MSSPYFNELAGVQPGNDLHAGWLSYALSLTQDDVHGLVRRGLTHQAESLRDMVREIVGGGAVPPSLYKKLDLIVLATRRHADTLR